MNENTENRNLPVRQDTAILQDTIQGNPANEIKGESTNKGPEAKAINPIGIPDVKESDAVTEKDTEGLRAMYLDAT